MCNACVYVSIHRWVSVELNCIVHTSLVPSLHTPPSEKQSGKQSQVFLDLLPKRSKNC